ncbi:MAG: hypothetical protein D6681_13620 [Calditrichaeota bacterium]|nr:MAG: hypothetical protein D6681_13620 [Calditrichota bacterium]
MDMIEYLVKFFPALGHEFMRNRKYIHTFNSSDFHRYDQNVVLSRGFRGFVTCGVPQQQDDKKPEGYTFHDLFSPAFDEKFKILRNTD